MHRRIFPTVLFAALSTTGVFAQTTTTAPTPPTPAQRVADKVARLTTLLTLTSAQQAQATTLFTDQQAAVSGLFDSMHTARAALQTAVKANDQGGISTQAAQIGTLTTQQIQAQSTADAAFYAILTADQQAKLDSLQTHGPGGPGGFGGPGGGHGRGH